MGQSLPSATALMNSTAFCGEAQKYRDEQFERLLQESSKKLNADGHLIEAGYAMLDVLRARTAEAFAKEANIVDGWLASSAESLSEQKKQEQVMKQVKDAEIGMDRMINELKSMGVSTVRIDIAFEQSTGRTLVGYTSMDVSAIDAHLGQPVYPTLVNEALFVQEGVICRDGAFFQGETRTALAKDDLGHPIIATQESVDAGLAFLQEKLIEKGIECQVVYRSYAEAKIEADNALAASESQTSMPAPSQNPTVSSGEVEPDSVQPT